MVGTATSDSGAAPLQYRFAVKRPYDVSNTYVFHQAHVTHLRLSNSHCLRIAASSHVMKPGCQHRPSHNDTLTEEALKIH